MITQKQLTDKLGKIRRALWRPLHKPKVSLPYSVLGTAYGGWPVVEGSISKESVIYSFGVGTDISFDLSIIKMYGAKVKAFDPTPRCLDWVKQQDLPKDFKFYSIGLSDRHGVLEFSAPTRSDFVSYTTGDSGSSEGKLLLPVRALHEIMSDLGDSHIDYLKMDIEGSEYLVIPDILSRKIFPKFLSIEFHHNMFGFSAKQTRNSIQMLEEHGFKIYYVSSTGREYGFVFSP